RANMESATPKRQSLQAAGMQLPEELSASNGVGATLGAMMGDQSLRKAWGERNADEASSGRQRKRGAFDLLGQPARRSVTFAVAQCRVADARELVRQRAGGLVVVSAALHGERPLAQAIDRLAGALRHAGRAQQRARAVGEQHAQVAITALGDTP